MVCRCCKRELEEWEEKRLDCGHYACNSHTYERNDVYRCEQCDEEFIKVKEKDTPE